MSLSKEENFNEEWRSLFENAEESPSDELWDSIARRLDEEEAETVIPLWPQVKPWFFGVAAALIALLVGWWVLPSIENAGPNQPLAEHSTPSADTQPAGEQLAKSDKTASATSENRVNPATASGQTKTETAPKREEAIAASRSATSKKNTTDTPSLPELNHSETASAIDGLNEDQSALAANRDVARTRRSSPATDRSTQTASENRLASLAKPPKTDKTVTADAKVIGSETVPTGNSNILPDEPAGPVADTRLAYEASYINSKITAAKAPRPISRIIWYRSPDPAIEPDEKGGPKKEYWAAVTATPMSFNPMTSVQSNLSLAPMYSNAIAQGNRQLPAQTVQNQSRISMAWQASSGVKLSKHWSVEAGVQYLNGRSQARNSASVTNAITNQTENLLVNAIRNSSPSVAQDAAPQNTNSLLPSGLDKNNLVNSAYLTVIPSDQLVNNDFQYIQVPVHIGYHILPERKFSYSILGGLMANVFLKNTVNGTLEVDRADQVYRPMAMAGTAGLRVNYHPTHHWSGSLTGSYQQSLQNGTQLNTQLQVRPQALGVGFGLNYHF